MMKTQYQTTKYLLLTALASIGLSLVLASAARAGSLEKRLEALDQRQGVLERKWELQEEKAQEAAQVMAGKDGFYLKTGDGKLSLKLGALVQTDQRFYLDDSRDLGKDTILLRRVRPILEGHLQDRFSFRIVPDFGQGQSVLQDGYADIRFFSALQLRGGKFKVPIGLERLQSDTNSAFVEPAFPTALVPNRDIGFQLFGDLWDGLLSYAVGGFNGVSDGASGDVDTRDGKDIAGRIFAHPFLKTEWEGLNGLGIGFGGSYGRQKGTISAPALPAYRTAGQLTFFSYHNTAANASAVPPVAANITVANGAVTRISPQAYYFWGPLGILAEYARSSQNITNGTSDAKLSHDAWEGTASFVLTGEKASYKGVKPLKPFHPQNGRWGAVELVGRYNELRIDSKTFPTFSSATAAARRARSFGGGVNWYLNDYIKLVASFERTGFQGGSVAGNRPAENLLASRLQLTF